MGSFFFKFRGFDMNSDMAMSTEILNKDKQEFVFGLKKATIGFNDVLIVK